MFASLLQSLRSVATIPLKALSTLPSLPFRSLSWLKIIMRAALWFSLTSVSTLISTLYTCVQGLLSLPFKALSAIPSLLIHLASSPSLRWASAITLLLLFISHLYRPKHCQCRCIRITAYRANGVQTPVITGCLHCDHDEHLLTKAQQALSDLRKKRNSHAMRAGMGLGVTALGWSFTGPLLDIFSGNWLGISYKAYRFGSVNAAVNRLKPFVTDVLSARAPVQGCLCRGAPLEGSKSGLCIVGGGEESDEGREDERPVEFDGGELKDHFVEEIEQGSSLWEAVCNLSDLSPI